MGSDYTYNVGMLFAKVASANALRPALRYAEGEPVSYGRLQDLSGRVAGYLLSRGARSGQTAAIFHDKSEMAYAIMLACLSIGVTYVNLDPASPPQRLERMLGLCEPSWFFAPKNINPPVMAHTVLLNYATDDFLREVSQASLEQVQRAGELVNGNTPAYLMFTSGSTGFPKAVVISHANLLNFIGWAQSVFGIGSSDVMTGLNPVYFDNSVFDFYGALFSGACLLPVLEDVLRVPRRLLDLLNTLRPTIWFSVPSLLVYTLTMRALKAQDLPSLRVVSFGGEGFAKNPLRELWRLWSGRVRFVNVYGPTECTCICSSYDVVEEDMLRDELLPLGPVAPNFGFVVVDNALNPVGASETGELCLSGPNVGKGYFRNPEKTREAFIQHPQISSHVETVYRTGDLVQYDEQRDLLYFRGRCDNQIKRMGYRIELEEIESALGALPQVRENAVVFRKPEAEGLGRIIAFLCADGQTVDHLREQLQQVLPSYMMPEEFRFLQVLPKNANGKIDRLALKELC